MKKSAMTVSSKFIALVMFQLFTIQAFAQEKGLDIDVDVNKNNGGDWTSNPWIWVGVGAFIIILILAMRGGNKSAS